MASDTLALVASLLIAAAEMLSPTAHFSHWSKLLFLIAVALLLGAFRTFYFVSALLLLALAGCATILSRLFPSSSSSSSNNFYGNNHGPLSILKDKVVHVLIPSVIHLIGVWCLPVFVLWGWCDAYFQRHFVVEEVGHLVPSTFYFTVLVLLPLFVMPRGYENGGIDHQFFESTTTFVAGVVFFIIFRTAHFFAGHNPTGYLSASGWDHELIGLVWAGGGATAMVMAKIGYKTSIHIAFPAAFVCFSMMSHNHKSAEAYDDDTYLSQHTQNVPWHTSWMRLHFMHGVAFGMVALCRLLYRLPEAVFFSFVGSVLFLFSSWGVVHPMHDALDWNIPPHVDRSDCSKCSKGYPTATVVSAIIVAIATVGFPVHLISLEQLRKFVEQSTPAAFSALSTEEPNDDTDETRTLTRMKDEKGGDISNGDDV